MALLQKLLHKLNGLHYPQEYLCFAKGAIPSLLQVYLVENNRVVLNITSHHLFTGYHPLIFMLPGTGPDISVYQDEITIKFSPKSIPPNEILPEKDALATLHLKKITYREINGYQLFFYEGIRGSHRLLSPFSQWINGQYNRRYNKKPGNVFLHENLYRQVQIAYSVPRHISLITVSNGEGYNLFPTDLHGPLGSNLYIISLRQAGLAFQQVAIAGKILISDINSALYKTAYALGKNHMRAMAPKTSFPFSDKLSQTYGLPLPQGALVCRELELSDSFTHDLHQLLLFRVKTKQQYGDEAESLVHVHNAYATWRHNKGLGGNYLFR